MAEEHPFAQYVRILGKGKRGSRGLTRAEARDAMRMILKNEIEECQLGAFLMLLRVKEETPEEVAGFVEAVKETFELPANAVTVDLDWSSYAGKRRHLPWFILSTLLLAESGIKIFMHGAEGHTAGRVYTRNTLEMLQLPIAASLTEANEQIQKHNFSYLPLEFLSPVMHRIIQLRPLLGLRSPVHTVARMFNPFNAPYEMQGIFHPSYRDTHQHAAVLLGQPHLAVLKGEGGEIERNPDQECLVKSVHDGQLSEEVWPPMFNGPRHLKDKDMDASRLVKIWNGTDEDEYAIASIIGTTAIALKLMGRENTIADAEQLASKMWQSRDVSRLSFE